MSPPRPSACLDQHRGGLTSKLHQVLHLHSVALCLLCRNVVLYNRVTQIPLRSSMKSYQHVEAVGAEELNTPLTRFPCFIEGVALYCVFPQVGFAPCRDYMPPLADDYEDFNLQLMSARKDLNSQK
jgi:hypothetical protein